MIAFLPDREFRRCVTRYSGDERLRGFSCWDQFLCMAFAQEIVRKSVESQRLSTFIDYATLAPFAIGCLDTALAIEDSSDGICLWPMILRNWRSATSNPEPTHRSI